MKSVLLIGLGRFGKYIAMKLDELHHQVLAVDLKEERVNEVLPYVTSAQIGDGTNEDFLASLGVGNFDVCIVAIGDDFQSSLETTSLLKNWEQKWWSPEQRGMFTRNFCCETEPMKSCIRRNRWRCGPR